MVSAQRGQKEADCIFEMSLDAQGRKVLDNEKETVEELMSRTKIRNPRFTFSPNYAVTGNLMMTA